MQPKPLTHSVGFGDLSDFEPSPNADIGHTETTPSKATMKEVRAEAERQGFVDREPMKLRRRWKPLDEPVTQLNFRVEVSAFNRFVRYCDRHNLSYREALNKLMDDGDA